MRDIAIIGFGQLLNQREYCDGNDMEILIDPVEEAVAASGLTRDQIHFTTGGSNDFLAGRAFSFVRALDVLNVYPCKEDSHVEMDGAWAVYEAWIRLQLGDIDTALIYGLGKTSLGDLDALMALSVDPYYMAPLGPDPTSIAALQARVMLDAGLCTEHDLATIVAARQHAALHNPKVEWEHARTHDEILAEPYRSAPLRPSMTPPITDGAAAIVLAADNVARKYCTRPAWIKGFDHRTDAHSLGVRDLTTCPSAAIAATRAGVANGPVEIAELHAAYAHEEIILRNALGLSDATRINPSGGALTANPLMATGLIRIGEAASHILKGDANRVVAHATTGPCLQNNMVMVLEAEHG